MASSSSLPSNVRISQHPSLQAKLSQLRSKSAGSRETNALVHEISLIVACEALSKSLTAVPEPKDQTPIEFEYETADVSPSTMCIVPILRSGLVSTLDPVEYYNNLPHHIPSSTSTSDASSLVILVDPIIATGGTCAAAVQTLREWGAKMVLVLAVMGAAEGVRKAAEEWPEGSELWIAGVDAELTKEGMVKPGLGDHNVREPLALHPIYTDTASISYMSRQSLYPIFVLTRRVKIHHAPLKHHAPHLHRQIPPLSSSSSKNCPLSNGIPSLSILGMSLISSRSSSTLKSLAKLSPNWSVFTVV
ncbi:hypothetical protein CNMCM5793_005371 [Aspergillus hiratsukae]|uniref:uracil phosphoribosyltransferase n=1 Tax=Aspergillus hiratsukae TaxID=1194566 RepID=A0A8H6QCM9_9EURO|nr:hypothetical protein CNMCM5793_005371 [Aspergillus hiratsukae]KAF7171286.1 hypothetical protein CNMCM6106_005683 [Aspergillus hiratsukae]